MAMYANVQWTKVSNAAQQPVWRVLSTIWDSKGNLVLDSKGQPILEAKRSSPAFVPAPPPPPTPESDSDTIPIIMS